MTKKVLVGGAYAKNLFVQARRTLLTYSDQVIAQRMQDVLDQLAEAMEPLDLRGAPELWLLKSTGEVSLEWIFGDCRFGCVMEASDEESSWFIVYRLETGRKPISGTMLDGVPWDKVAGMVQLGMKLRSKR